MNTLSKENKEIVKQILSDKFGADLESIQDDTILGREGLGADSLDILDLVMEFEKRFDIYISDDQTEDIKTVANCYELINNLIG